MNESRLLLADTVTRLFSDISESDNSGNPAGTSDPWQLLEDLGLPSLMLDEDKGGFKGNWQDAVLVARLLGYYGIAQPLVETLLARFALQTAGHQDFSGPMSVAHCDAVTLLQHEPYYALTAQLRNVPWGQHIPIVVTGQHQLQYFVALLDPDESIVQIGRTNLAKEPRTDLLLETAPLRSLYWTAEPVNLGHLGALLRCAQIAGAMNRVVDLSVQYTSERQQFGRPISKFQVIQHSIAQLAEQTAAVTTAAEAAAQALDYEGDSGSALFEIAAAKLRANIAIPQATDIAHQVHGAIGFTEEHRLHRFTNRLLAWRNEYGNDRAWASLLGQWCLDIRTKGLWQAITARSDRQMNTATQQSTVLPVEE